MVALGRSWDILHALQCHAVLREESVGAIAHVEEYLGDLLVLEYVFERLSFCAGGIECFRTKFEHV